MNTVAYEFTSSSISIRICRNTVEYVTSSTRKRALIRELAESSATTSFSRKTRLYGISFTNSFYEGACKETVTWLTNVKSHHNMRSQGFHKPIGSFRNKAI